MGVGSKSREPPEAKADPVHSRGDYSILRLSHGAPRAVLRAPCLTHDWSVLPFGEKAPLHYEKRRKVDESKERGQLEIGCSASATHLKDQLSYRARGVAAPRGSTRVLPRPWSRTGLGH